MEPLTFDFTYSGQLTARVYLNPWIEPTLYNTITFRIDLLPYFGVNIAVGSTSNCREAGALVTPPSYETFFGLDIKIGVQRIVLKFPLMTKDFGKDLGLPYSKTFSIFGPSKLECSRCAGCITLSGSAFRYGTGPWSLCSKACAGGIQVRTVACMNKAENVVEMINCRGEAPASIRSCNTDSCAGGLTAARDAACACLFGHGPRKRYL